MIGTFLMLGKVNFKSLSRLSNINDQLVFLSKVYLRLDQPLAALEVRCKREQDQISFLNNRFLFFLQSRTTLSVGDLVTH